MPALHPRSRVVLFRVTEEEYDVLRLACREKGGRNLSEFTRSLLFRAVRGESTDGAVERHYAGIECTLGDLRASVEKLLEIVEEDTGRRPARRRQAAGQD
jgi:hypothetical protein